MNEAEGDTAHLCRLAQANKMIHLGLVERDVDGNVIPTVAMEEMDSPIKPDPVDFEAVRRTDG